MASDFVDIALINHEYFHVSEFDEVLYNDKKKNMPIKIAMF